MKAEDLPPCPKCLNKAGLKGSGGMALPGMLVHSYYCSGCMTGACFVCNVLIFWNEEKDAGVRDIADEFLNTTLEFRGVGRRSVKRPTVPTHPDITVYHWRNEWVGLKRGKKAS